MQSVCVIGGGSAGAEAAREAVRDGARVTIIEKAPGTEVPWKQWPDLIHRRVPPRALAESAPHLPLGVALLKAEARSVQGGTVLHSEGTSHFDAVIAATGSDSAPVTIRGCRKRGVHLLRSAGDFATLGRSRSSIARAVVVGEGMRALQVADRLSGDGRSVRIVVTSWRHGVPSPDVLEVLKRAAEENHVAITSGEVTQAVGQESLEAVVIGGSVTPSDALVAIPLRVPRPVPTDAKIGWFGGLSVDHSLRTSSPHVLAAGGCAECFRPGSRPRLLDEEPGISGRVAGANSLGYDLAIDPTTRWEVRAFGVIWSGVEFEPSVSEYSRASLGTVSRRSGLSACSITFERSRGRVLKVESAQPEGSSLEGPPFSAVVPSLRSIAYGGSSDISLVSDTARMGLRIWSNF